MTRAHAASRPGTPSDAPALVCPVDRSPLSRRGEGAEEAFLCASCGSRFPVEGGVVRFLGESDRFYEGRYLNTIRYVPRSESLAASWPLWLINDGYVWAARRHVPAGGVVVELGCAGGVRYFAKRWRVVGLDLSLGSLSRVADTYALCLQADLTRGVPLPDASVDAVLSSFVWEHIPPERKPGALAELHRILRPGGHLVFLYDVDPRNPIYDRMRRRNPALFQRIFIAGDSHEGWQSPAENRAQFEDGGFEVVEQRGKEKIFFSPSTYGKMAHWGGGFERLAALGNRLRGGRRFQIYNAFQRGFDETVGRLLPEDWARVLVTVCRKAPDDPPPS